MVVLRSRVAIRAPCLEGKEVILNLINEGEILGEIALLDGKECTADAMAMTDCELLVVAHRSFLPLLERPGVARERRPSDKGGRCDWLKALGVKPNSRRV